MDDDEYDIDDPGVDEDFDYDEYIAANHSDGLTNTETKPVWRLVAVILLVVFSLGLLLQIASLL